MVFLNQILFIIVTYKEEFYKCNSYTTLINSFNSSSLENKKLNIFIADNTDIEGWECSIIKPDNNIFINYQKYDNPGLSFAYNKGAEFAKENNYSWLVLLDQDTMLPTNFFDEYNDAINNDDNIPLKVPLILIDNDKILSPAKYINYRSILYNDLNKGIMNLNGHSFINTGMFINTDFFIKIKGYNENIKLDFSDHDFIYKCKKFINKFEVLPIKLVQDFSSITNTKEQAIKRYSLYLRDLKAFKIKKENRLSLFINADLRRLVKLVIQYKSFDFIKIRLKKW
ncbi:Glycosyltransferase, GT2 family [Chishuiella changwenlii]|uniref:Glycosyl transferase family 2 n=1 Tax=Chishuiella changwenlii TaxID=1434701 RepID=A0A1M7A5I7_9FLAO|nr:hypothetical protein [Chishuiella changwenlii]GGE91538.1 glycosyl transferase family 2 [Chishuiella changwenlii]SHL37909.1 Glycosyltransferase, GT2 family [Chishuiella changwenlii]